MKFSLKQALLAVICTTVALANPTEAQDILNKVVSVNLQNVELKQAIEQLGKTADIAFVYSPKAIKANRKVTISAQNRRLADILSSTLEPLSIGYKVVGKQILLNSTLNLGEAPPLSKKGISAAERLVQAVSGVVKDVDGVPLSGVNVVIKGTTKGTTTDLDGRFSLDANAGDLLVFSFVGFKTLEYTVGANSKDIQISMSESDALNAVTVVGSRFAKPRTDVDRPVPIDVITVKDIQSTGQVDLGQAIHYSAPSFNAVKFGINDGAPFVDPATLRGLGPDQVLVLVNNRRRHKVSFLSINDGIGKGQAGTDVNVVPTLSLKRVEVLRDGAAAQYGSDAIAGVINLQLNNASSGGAVSTYFGNGYSKPNLDVKDVNDAVANRLIQDGLTYNFAANMGFKLGQKGFLNATASYSHTDGYDRSGSYSNPNATSSSTNFYSRTQSVEDSLLKARGITTLDRAILGSAENTTYGLFVNSGFDINDKWSAYAFGGYTNKHVVTGVFTRPPSNTRRNALTIYPDGYNPIAPADLQDFSLTAGAKGTVGKDWALDMSIGQGMNQVDWYAENTVNPSLGAASPTSFYIGQTRVTQTLLNVDLAKTFNANSYPNYSIGVGTEVRYETFRQKAGDPASYEAGPLKTTKDVGSSGREGFSNKTAGDWNRTNVGVYVEAETEITNKLLFGAALRGENYSDFGGDFSYKVMGRYKIIDAIAVRGSVSRGFRAPSITQAHYSNYINVSFDNAGNSILNPIIPAESDLAAALGLGLENGLKKETSLDLAIGATAKIGEDFLFTADYYQVKVKDRVMLSGGIDVSKNATFTAAGFTQTANVFVNAFNTKTNGLELVAAYNKKIGSDSKLGINLAYSQMITIADTAVNKVKKTSAGAPVADNAAILYITDGQPKDKFISSFTYDYKGVGFLFRASRFGKIVDPLATLATADPATGLKYQTFGAKTLLDFAITIRPIKKLSITLGVNNIADVYPDLLAIPQTTNEVIYSRRTNQFGTQGRFWNAAMQYNF